jgi:hypothetical protein
MVNMMLQIDDVRRHRQQVADALAKIDREREQLIAMLKADDEWLVLSAPSSKNGSIERVPSKVTHEEAALTVLADAHGGAMHSKEIWPRMSAMGATSKSDDPVSSVDLTMHALRKEGLVEKTDARTHRITAKGEELAKKYKHERQGRTDIFSRA